MKIKKLLSFILVAVMIIVPATSALAAKKSTDNQPLYKSFTGIAKEISKSETAKDTTYIHLESKEGLEANLVLTKETYYINEEEIRIGSEVTGYYDANAMMIMIYPPQYVAVAVLVSNKEQNIKVDLFNGDLISADNMLKLNITKDTLVVTKDGKEYKGDLTNRKLAVTYGATTRSIPAQANPYKVVVLSDSLIPDQEGGTYYGSFTGTVTALKKVDKDSIQITLKNEDELEALFTVNKNTYRFSKEAITVGAVVTGYYDAKVSRIMIYPAQYEAELIDVESRNHNIKVDYFNNKLISADGTLMIKLGKDTEIIHRDGTKYNGKPVNSNLVVVYDKATKSIPAQTEPLKVIVLKDSGQKGSEDVKGKDKEYWNKKLEEWKKITIELIENYDKVFDSMDELNSFIDQMFNGRLLFGFNKQAIKKQR